MNRFLPSKKLVVFLSVIGAVLLVFLIVSKYQNRKTVYLPASESNPETKNALETINQQIIQADSDGDGLKDWEEVLWKTNPDNPDTDGDGTNDNDEILANRNPLIPGPDDLMENDIIVQHQSTDNIQFSQTLTQTDLLARELFSGYLMLKQNDQLGGEQQTQFIEALAKKHTLSASPKKYTLSDLTVIQNDSQNIIQQYADKLAEIMRVNSDMEHDVIIAKNALERNDKKELEKIAVNIKVYESMREQFLSLEVPIILSHLHLELINGISNLIGDALKLSLIFEDPIAGLASAKNYMSNELIVIRKFVEIGVFFKENGIEI